MAGAKGEGVKDGSKMTAKEKKLVAEIGARWLRMTDEEVLGEAAILFRLSVAIVGHHQSLTGKKGDSR